jgi:ABC-2 type transport system ATP-binding protein
MPTIVSFDHVCKSFLLPGWKQFVPGLRRRKPVLTDICLDLPSRAWVGLYGPNGSGKTTFLRCLAGLLLPDRGTIRWQPPPRPLMGYCTGEDRGFHGRLTVKENLDFYARVFALSRRTYRDSLARLAAAFRMADLLPVPYQTLSTGQKQRVNLLRSLLASPSLLIFDEVAKSLDTETKNHLFHYTREVLVEASGATVLWASHDPAELKRWCSEVINFHSGRVERMPVGRFSPESGGAL